MPATLNKKHKVHSTMSMVNNIIEAEIILLIISFSCENIRILEKHWLSNIRSCS